MEHKYILSANANTPPWSRSPSQGLKKGRTDALTRRSPSLEILPSRTKLESPLRETVALPTPDSPRSARSAHDPGTYAVRTDPRDSISLSHPPCNDKGKQRAEPYIPFPSSASQEPAPASSGASVCEVIDMREARERIASLEEEITHLRNEVSFR